MAQVSVISSSSRASLEHRVAVRRLSWHDLQYIPVLNDLAVSVDTEDVDPGPILIFVGGPLLMAGQHYEFSPGYNPCEVPPFARICTSHLLEVINERLLAIGNMGIVLNV